MPATWTRMVVPSGSDWEAARVAMASSTGDDIPRGLEFLFSRNRFNVAISRAKALAVVVCSPKLLETRCHTVDQMRLVNGLCWFANDARMVTAY
jgi:hypothetical protein